MSRLYFASATGGAELAGPERHWLTHLAAGPAAAAWDLDGSGADHLDRCRRIISMIPEARPDGYGSNYLHEYLRKAEAADAAYHRDWLSVQNHVPYDHRPLNALVSSLRIRVATAQAYDTTFVVAGHTMNAANIMLNTALAAGSNPIRLAAKLSGWDFCLIEGEDRGFIADTIDAGLSGGMFRRGFGDWEDMGWGKVATFLREDNTQPVVTHHSTGESFPDRTLADWEPPGLPDGWAPDWADGEKGAAEWAAMPEDEKECTRTDHLSDQWYELPDAQRWDLALAGLRSQRPWCRLSDEMLAEVYFGPCITAYDLMAPDRDERVTRAFAAVRSS